MLYLMNKLTCKMLHFPKNLVVVFTSINFYFLGLKLFNPFLNVFYMDMQYNLKCVSEKVIEI